MTEVPEHLLRRSKERRAALGLGGGDDAGSPPATAGEADEAAAPSAAATPEKAAPAPAPAPAAPPPPAPAEPPRPLPPYVAAAVSRPKIPRWALPVLAILPLWALIYAGVLAQPEEGIEDPVLAEGQELYAANCAGCHGGGGEGGTGRPLGEVVLTFPDPADHIAWIENGSPAAGTPYGDPDRPGGQQVSQDGWGAMPGFGDSMTEEQIIAVTRYEREVIGGEEGGELAAGEGADGGTTPEGQADAEGGDTGADTGGGVEEGSEQSTSDDGDTGGSGGGMQGSDGQQQGSGG